MDILEAIRREREAKRQITQEEEDKFALVVQHVFSTPNGILFGKEVLKQIGFFSCLHPKDEAGYIEANCLRNFYIGLIRKHLTPEQITKLEIEDVINS